MDNLLTRSDSTRVRYYGYALKTSAVAIWAFNGVIGKKVAGFIDPVLMSVLSMLTAAIILSVFYYKEIAKLWSQFKDRDVILYALCNLALNSLLYFGFTKLSISTLAVIIKGFPGIVPILLAVLLRKRIPCLSNWKSIAVTSVSLMLIFLGIYLSYMTDSQVGAMESPLLFGLTLGILYATFSSGTYYFLVSYLSRKGPDMGFIIATHLISAFLGSVIFAFMTEYNLAFETSIIMHPEKIVWIILSGLLVFGIADLLSLRGLHDGDKWLIQVIYVIVFWAVVFQIICFNEYPTPKAWLGFIVLAIGLFGSFLAAEILYEKKT